MAHIKKRTYTSTVTGKTSTYYRASYVAPDGVNRTKQYRRKADAQIWLDLHGGDVARGEWLDPKAARVGFRQHAEEWKANTVKLRGSTKERDFGYLDRYILPTFGHMALGQIDHTAVQAWVTTLATRGPAPWWDTTDPKKKARVTRPVAPATAVKAYQIMTKIMSRAVAAKKIRWNPCTDIELPKIETDEMRFLNVNEIDAAGRRDPPPLPGHGNGWMLWGSACR